MQIVQHLTLKHGPASREPIRPTYLVLHDTEGSQPGVLSWLADVPSSRAPVSVHYLVCRDGTVYQIAKDTWSAWHAGRTYWPDRAPGISPSATGNYDMTGIEIEHVTATEGKTYPAAQLHALDELILLLYSRHHYRGTVGHKEIAYPRGRKSDPQLDVSKYSIQAVRARLGQMEEDDMTDAQDKLLKSISARLDVIEKKQDRAFVSDVARSYDWAIERATDAGDTAEVTRLTAEKAAELKDLKASLGLDK